MRADLEQLGLLEPAPAVDARPPDLEPWQTWTAGPAITLYRGDSRAVLATMPANSVDACVTDPPYGLGFMGAEWDTFDPDTIADNARKALTAGASRNRDHENPNVRGRARSPAMSPSQIEYDRTVEGQRKFQQFTEAWARELARVLKPGAYGAVCGAPRSAHRMTSGLEDAGLDICDSVAWLFGQGFPKSHNLEGGRGTAIKPAHEPIVIVQKPFNLTVKRCAEEWGTGVLNIADASLPVEPGDRDPRDGIAGEVGRWPPNVAMDEAAAAALDAQAGVRASGPNPRRRHSPKFDRIFNRYAGAACAPRRGANRGGASRFFFVAKPSRAERDYGCDAFPLRTPGECTERIDGSAGITPYAGAGRSGGGRNFHPTVKPVALMRWIVRLIAPPAGVVVDPFTGSGTTGMACLLEGRSFIGIEDKAAFLELAGARIRAVFGEVYGETTR